MSHRFALTLFSTRPEIVRQAMAAGVAEFIVDWECQGKKARQAGADTQVNGDTPDDLRRVRACTGARVLCRLNGFGPTTAQEVECAIEAGADEILLPMVRSTEEVSDVLRLARARCGVGILVETAAAVHCSRALGRLPLSRVYVGLNDLAIDRGSPSIFAALADGTVERVREAFRVPFGFGGLTLPECGRPIPCRLLIGEMARLGCSYSFLRRSFYRDIDARAMEDHVPRILSALDGARTRSAQAIAADRRELEAAIASWPSALAGRGEQTA